MPFNADDMLGFRVTAQEFDQLVTTVRWSTVVQANLLTKLMGQAQEQMLPEQPMPAPTPSAAKARGNSGVSHPEPAAQP